MKPEEHPASSENSSESQGGKSLEWSQEEMKIIERMRHYQKNWRIFRWLQLFAWGFLPILLGIFFLYQMRAILLNDNSEFVLLLLALCVPVIFAMIAFGSYAAAAALSEWHGKKEYTLLLAIVKKLEDR
jgi:membrane-bound metal-dependent hydrolase YbcI (DUF457 family)